MSRGSMARFAESEFSSLSSEFENTEPLPLMSETSDEDETVPADLLPNLNFEELPTKKATFLPFGFNDSALDLEDGLEIQEVNSQALFDMYFKE